MKYINNQYKVIEYIGEDACGHVYKVYNEKMNRYERLKIFNNKFFKENAIKFFAERFIELSTMNHPNISELYVFSRIDFIDEQKHSANKYFYTFEDFSCDEGIDYLSLSREDTHHVLMEICRGLQYLHFRNECYTYLNFENLTFYKSEEGIRVKFNDLSHILQYKYLAKYNSKEVNQFLSPKLVWAESLDTSSDLYSLGIVFYYLYYKYDYKNVTLSLDALEGNAIHRAIYRLTTTIKEEAYKDIGSFIEELVQLLRLPYDFSDKVFYEQLNFKNRLIGRDKEINRIIKIVLTSLQLQCEENCILVHGRKGVGKSRLLKELSFRFQFQGYNVFMNNKKTNGHHFGFFKDILREIALNEVVDINLIRKYGAEIGSLIPDIARHWRITSEVLPVEEIGALRIANRIFKFLEEYVVNKQLILVIDNINHMDYYDCRVLEYLINTERERPLFIVAGIDTLDDEQSEMLQYDPKKVGHISIVNYSYSDTADFIKTCLGKGKEDIKFVSAVMNATNGNPALIIQSLERLFSQDKIFVDTSRSWDFSRVTTFNDLIIEETNHDEIIDINQFSKLEICLLAFLSICDIPMIDEIIMESLDLTVNAFEETIIRLKAEKVLDSKFSDWGFTYFVSNKWLRKELAKTIPRETALKYHRGIAVYLENKYNTDNKFLDDRLIYHLEKSEQYEKCAQFSLLYAKKLKKYSLKEAQSLLYYNKVIQYSTEIGQQDLLVDTHIEMGDIYQEIDRFDDALVHYEIAKKIALEEEFDHKEIDTMNRIGHIELKRLNYKLAKDLFLYANNKSREINYFQGELHAAVHLVDYYFETQLFNRAMTLVEHYIPLCNPERDHRNLGRFYHRKGSHHYINSRYLEAKECFETAIEILEEQDNADIVSKCLNNIGAIEMDFLGNYEKALDYFLNAEELSLRNNVFLDVCIYKVNIGAAYFKLGKYVEAMDHYDKAITIANESDDKRDFFLISTEVCRDYTVYGAYDKAFSMLKKLEMDYSGIIDGNKYIDIHAEMNIRYFVSFENYEIAYKWYNRFKKYQTPLKPRGFSEKLSEVIFEEYHLHMNDVITESLLWRLGQLKELALSVIDFQSLRAFTLRIAKKLLTSSNFILLKKFVDFDQRLAEHFDCSFLSLRHEILVAAFSNERIEEYERIIETYKEEYYDHIQWISHKLLADEYNRVGQYFKAMSHYTTALDMIKIVAFKIPEEYRRNYIVNDALKLQLKNRIMELYGKIINGRSVDTILMIESEIGSLDDFFDVRALDTLFTQERFAQDVYESLFKQNYPKMMDIEAIIGDIQQEHESNLKGILIYFAQILCADYGCIVFRDDVNGIEKIFEMGQSTTKNVEVLKNNLYYENEGLYINSSEEGIYTYLLKEGRKAILYIPIFEKISYREKDDFDDYIYENEIGYIYLESRHVLNSFNEENFNKCRLMMNLVKAFLENYRLRILSTVDKLTGVYLRKYTEEEFGDILVQARQTNTEVAVIMCDIDKFKHVNDTYGHRKGDDILRSIGGLLNEVVGQKGLVGRYGGEEFLIVLANVSTDEGFRICETLRDRIQQDIRVEAGKPVTMSFGLASYPIHGFSEDELVENADKALYYSKNTGRNRSTIWHKEISGDQYRFDRLAGILTGNSAVDATNMQSIVEVIGMLKQSLGKQGKLLKVLENLIDITKAEAAYIVERQSDLDLNDLRVYMKERGSDQLNEDYRPDEKIIYQYLDASVGDYFVNWDNVPDNDIVGNMPNWKSIIVSPLFDGERSKGLVVVEVPIVEREFDFNNYNYVNLMSGLISAII